MLERQCYIDYILKRDKIKGCVLPKGKVYIQNNFRGITMDYHQNYTDLIKFMNSENISHLERLKLCKEIIESVKELHKNDLVHGDINIRNVMIAKDLTSSLLIDVDGGFPKELMDEEDFQYEVRNDQYLLMLVVMSFVYNFKFERYIYKYDLEKFKEILLYFPISKELREYINRLINNKNSKNEYIDEYLNDMQENKSNKVLKF